MAQSVSLGSLPIQDKVKDALHSVNAQLQKYGSRVTGSIGNSDLKSISHAVRILDEVKTLREHGVITFPLPKSEYFTKQSKTSPNTSKLFFYNQVF